MMRLNSRLEKLEKIMAVKLACPLCRLNPIPIFVVNDAGPFVAPPCPQCCCIPEVFQVIRDVPDDPCPAS